MLKYLKISAGSSEEQIRLLFTLVGLATGLLGYCYYEYIDGLIATRNAVSVYYLPLFFLSTFANFFFMTYERQYDVKSLAFSLGLSSLLSFFLYLKIDDIAALPALMWLFWVISQISLPLGISFIEQGHRHPSYEILHRKAWNLPLFSFSASCLVGLMWLVLGLCAFMLSLIGIKLHEVISELWFAIPFSAAVYGLGIAIAREKERTIAMMRDLFLNLKRTVLPMLALVLIIMLPMFLLVLFGYLQPDLKVGDTIAIVYSNLFMIVFAIVAINAAIAYDDASSTHSRITILSAKAATIGMMGGILIPLVYVLRMMGEFGFTPARLYGFIGTILLLLYAATYTFALWRNRKDTPQWFETMRRHNVWIAYVVLAVALWLASPVGNMNAIATAEQIDRLKNGKVSFEQFDFTALNTQFGAEGKKAIEDLSKDTSYPDHAKVMAEAQKTLYERREDKKSKLPLNVKSLPEGTPIPEALLKNYTIDNQCRTVENECVLIKADLITSNDTLEYLLLQKNNTRAKLLIKNPKDVKDIWYERYLKTVPADLFDKASDYRMEERKHNVVRIGDIILDPVSGLD